MADVSAQLIAPDSIGCVLLPAREVGDRRDEDADGRDGGGDAELERATLDLAGEGQDQHEQDLAYLVAGVDPRGLL